MLVSPDELITAAQRLAIIESDIGAANLNAVASTTKIATAAHDEVSQSVAELFSTCGQQFHAAVEQNGIFGTQRFAARLTAAASSYNSTEAATVASLIQDQINSIQEQIGVATGFLLALTTVGLIELVYVSFKASYPLAWPLLKLGSIAFNDSSFDLPAPGPWVWSGPWLWWELSPPPLI